MTIADCIFIGLIAILASIVVTANLALDWLEAYENRKGHEDHD